MIDATWEDLPGNALGSAGANNLFYNFGGAPANGVLYPSPLANKLAGSDLDPGQADISANFDSGTNWYYGLDGNTPFSQFDLVSVVLHEIGHGLGFAGTAFVGTDLNGYILNGSLPHVYDGFVWTGNSIPILDLGSGTAAFGRGPGVRQPVLGGCPRQRLQRGLSRPSSMPPRSGSKAPVSRILTSPPIPAGQRPFFDDATNRQR